MLGTNPSSACLLGGGIDQLPACGAEKTIPVTALPGLVPWLWSWQAMSLHIFLEVRRQMARHRRWPKVPFASSIPIEENLSRLPLDHKQPPGRRGRRRGKTCSRPNRLGTCSACTELDLPLARRLNVGADRRRAAAASNGAAWNPASGGDRVASWSDKRKAAVGPIAGETGKADVSTAAMHTRQPLRGIFRRADMSAAVAAFAESGP
jgi:hypothetical protein